MWKNIRFLWIFLLATMASALLTWQTPSQVHSTGALYVAPDGSDTNDCRSPSAPCRTITAATRKAAAGDTIYVAAGTYSSASGETFPIQLPPRVSLIGSGPEATTIQGTTDQPVLKIVGNPTPVLSDTVISGLTCRNGDIGLYLYATDGYTVSPSIINLHLVSNRVGLLVSTGGDYFTIGAFVSPMISDTQVISNRETGIVLDAYTFNTTCLVSPTILNSIIQNNGGDGLFLGAATPSNTDCSASPRMIQTRIADNDGNGINSGTGGYGATRPLIERSAIIGNKRWGIRWGGSWGFDQYPRGIVVNSIIARNLEGGVFIDEGYGDWQMINTTVADNEQYGIYYRTRRDQNLPFVIPTITNTIIWNPLADDLAGGPWSVEYIRFSDIEDGDFVGQEGNISADPLLTEDYHLSACSPAINAGTGASAPAQDIDGESRPIGTAVDIGADEYGAPCWLSLSKHASANRSRYGNVLTYTIAITNTTALTPLNVILTDSLPPSLTYLPGSLWFSQGEASYADGRVTWSDTLAPGNIATVTFQARVQQANAWVRNWAVVEAGDAGIYVRRTDTWVDPTRVYLPLIRKPRPGIYGKVTFNGGPAQWVLLELRFYDGNSWSTLSYAVTDHEGNYVFENVPNLGPGQMYYVRFYNHEERPGYLFAWHTRVLTSYGGSADMGTFDIADVELQDPNDGATVSLPYTFRWRPRPATPSDSYEFDLYDPTDGNPYFYTPPLGYVGNYTLTGLPGGFSTDDWYVWEVWIYSPDGGFGISREARWVKFSNATARIAGEMPPKQAKSAWWAEDWARDNRSTEAPGVEIRRVTRPR